MIVVDGLQNLDRCWLSRKRKIEELELWLLGWRYLHSFAGLHIAI